MSAESVRIHEVSPRDGLQNEPEVVATDDKVELVRRLVASGLRDVEITSFVRPSWIPQLADAAELVARLPRAEGVRHWALVPNLRGLERALDAGLRHVATFMSASETHNRRNVNRTRRESLAILDEVVRTARAEGLVVRAYVSTAFGCPYEGEVPVEQVVEVALPLLDAGADVVALGDTTGMGDPRRVERVVATLVDSGVPADRIALHAHDTRGTALANVLAAYQAGVRIFDASVAGVGGCPYAPGAAGNLATEDLVYMFDAMGVRTGVDLDALANTGLYLEQVLGHPLPGRYHRFHVGRRALQAERGTA